MLSCVALEGCECGLETSSFSTPRVESGRMANPNEDTTQDLTRYNKRLMNNVVRFPMVVGECDGTFMLDSNHGPLMDFWGDEGVCSLGYNTPEVIRAIMAFMASGHPHQLPDIYPNEKRWQAAEVLCDRTGMDKVFFANSGAEANEGAIKLARKYWWDKEPESTRDPRVGRRHRVLTIEGNFHGRTGLAMAAGDYRVSPYHRHGFGPLAQGFGVLQRDHDAPDGFSLIVTDSEEHEAREPDWSEVAAITLAPVLGNNCVKTYPREFWQALSRIRDTHGVLLIYDDVQAGSGRAGYYATWQHPDICIQPDIMMLAKGMAMGFPMSCILAREGVAAAFTPGVHFNTFGGSPFVCHMATEMFQWLDGNLDSIRNKGDWIRRSFRARDWIAESDGSGLLNAFTPDFAKYKYDGFQFIHRARELGLSLATHRPFGAIRFTPRLNIPNDELMRAMSILDATHADLAG